MFSWYHSTSGLRPVRPRTGIPVAKAPCISSAFLVLERIPVEVLQASLTEGVTDFCPFCFVEVVPKSIIFQWDRWQLLHYDVDNISSGHPVRVSVFIA